MQDDYDECGPSDSSCPRFISALSFIICTPFFIFDGRVFIYFYEAKTLPHSSLCFFACNDYKLAAMLKFERTRLSNLYNPSPTFDPKQFKKQDAQTFQVRQALFLFYRYCDLENQRWVKGCLYFPTKLECQKFSNYRNYGEFSTLSRLLSMFHFQYCSIGIAALINRQFDVPHVTTLQTIRVSLPSEAL